MERKIPCWFANPHGRKSQEQNQRHFVSKTIPYNQLTNDELVSFTKKDGFKSY
jgi:hypothetical protein